MWFQRTIQLAKRRRGFHLVTDEVVAQCPEIETIQTGILHLFIQHTSASLTITENADPDVRADLESAFNRQVPENQPFVHTIEGPDDMPAHVKSCMLGNSLSIPIGSGRLLLGTWQGITLAEHRNHATPRNIVCTIWGEVAGT